MLTNYYYIANIILQDILAFNCLYYIGILGLKHGEIKENKHGPIPQILLRQNHGRAGFIHGGDDYTADS